MSTSGIDQFGEWPSWAPARLVEIYRHLDPVSDPERGNDSFQAVLLATIETLCVDPRIEAVWAGLNGQISDSRLPVDLAEVITKAMMPPSKGATLTAAQRLRKREQAAAAARELRNHLSDLGLDSQTVFPVLSPKATGLAIHYFLQDHAELSVDLKWWRHEASTLNALLMRNEPGVGSWRDTLDRLAEAVTKGEGTFHHTSKIDDQDDNDGRATNFAEQVSDLLAKHCQQLPAAQILRLTEVFFPGAGLDYESLGRRLRRRHPKGGDSTA